MVQHPDIELAGGLPDAPGEFDVLDGGLGVGPGMVVDEDDAAGLAGERHTQHLPGIDRRLVHRALADPFPADEPVLVVEQGHPEFLVLRGPDPGLGRLGHDVGTVEDHPVPQGLLVKPGPGLAPQGEELLKPGAETLHLPQFAHPGGQRASQGAEAGQQFLGQGLVVAADVDIAQEQLQDLVIGQCPGIFHEPVLEASPVAEVVGTFFLIKHGCGPGQGFLGKSSGRSRPNQGGSRRIQGKSWPNPLP